MLRSLLFVFVVGCACEHPPSDTWIVDTDGSVGVDAGPDAADAAVTVDANAPDGGDDGLCVRDGLLDTNADACAAWDNATIRALLLCGNTLPCPWVDDAPTRVHRIACVTLLGDASTCDELITAVDACQCGL